VQAAAYWNSQAKELGTYWNCNETAVTGAIATEGEHQGAWASECDPIEDAEPPPDMQANGEIGEPTGVTGDETIIPPTTIDSVEAFDNYQTSLANISAETIEQYIEQSEAAKAEYFRALGIGTGE
jgi:hypothetical protein